MTGLVGRYRQYLIAKTGESAGVGGRMIDVKGQALWWMLPIAIAGLVCYLGDFDQTQRLMTVIPAGLISLGGMLFAGITMLTAGVRVDLDNAKAARNSSDG